jgi:hypothetical protein
MKKIISVIILLSLPAIAKITRQHGVHQHGAGTLGIAFDDKTGKVDFKITTSSIMGFEYTPKTGREKKLKEMQLELFQSKISDMISFPSDLGCTFSKDKIEVVKDEKESKEHHAEHSDLVATFNVVCKKSPMGSRVTFNFQKYFPNIHDLDVNIIIGDLQKSAEVKTSGSSLDLTK